MKWIRVIAMIIFSVTIIMPFWSYVYPSVALAKEGANFAETFSQKTSFIGFALGSTLDQSVDAVTNIAHSTYHAASAGWQVARLTARQGTHQISLGHQMLVSSAKAVRATTESALSKTTTLSLSFQRKLESRIKETGSQIKFGMTNTIERQHSMLSLPVRSFAKAGSPAAAGRRIHRILGALANIPLSYLSSVKGGLSAIIPQSGTKEDALALLPETHSVKHETQDMLHASRSMLHDSQEPPSSAPTHETPPPLHEREILTHLH